MRILFVAHRLPYPPNKGDKVRSFWELDTLTKKHEVDLFCFYDDPNDEQHLSTVRNFCHSVYAERLTPWNSRVGAVRALLQRRPFSLGYFGSETMGEAISKSIATRHYDVALVFCSSMAQYLEGHNIPTVLDMVDVDSEKWRQYALQSRPPQAWLWRLEATRLREYERHAAQAFTTTLVVTEVEAARLRTLVGDGADVRCLPNSLDTAYFDPSQAGSSSEIGALKPYVVFSGQMDYPPNIDAVRYFTSEVLPTVHAHVPDLRFVIVGRNPPASVSRLARNPQVIVTGTVADVRPYLRGAALAVVPLRLGTGVSNKIMEALAMDLPVVASSAFAAALPPELAALVDPADTPEEYVEHVTKIVGGHRPPSDVLRQAVLRYFSRDIGRELQSIVTGAARRSALDGAGRAAAR